MAVKKSVAKKTSVSKKPTVKKTVKAAAKPASEVAKKPADKAEVSAGAPISTADLVGRPLRHAPSSEVGSQGEQAAPVSSAPPVRPPVVQTPVVVPPVQAQQPTRPQPPQVQPQAPVQAPTPAGGETEIVGGRKVWRSAGFAGNGEGFEGEVDGRVLPDAGLPTEKISGLLDRSRDGNGILRTDYSFGNKDAYISGTQIRRFGLKPGDLVEGPARMPKDNEQFWGLLKVEKINGKAPDVMQKRVKFGDLTPVFPDKKLVLETDKEILSTRLIDLVAPVGMGQRGMIVSPPKAGKTTVLKDIATGIATNYKDVHLMAVLIGERPEEVTDIRRHVEKLTDGKGEVAASNFDEPADEQARIAELALERGKRLVELGRDVVILLDSITRLARAYNLAIPTSGRTLSGGFDPAALYPPKKFFGAARNFEPFQTPNGKKDGSLTILGTALIDTGSKMDDLIYEEFKGTGNMELHLDRNLAERRVYPAIDVQRSGTRREDLLFSANEYQSVVMMRRMVDILDPKERTSVLAGKMKQTKNNKEFLASLKEG